LQLQPCPVPARDSVPLKQLKDFTLIGTPAKRPGHTGQGRRPGGIRHRYEVGGMTIAAIAISPVLGGKPKSGERGSGAFCEGRAPGGADRRGRAVVADHMWAAKKGLKATATQWDDGANATVDSASLIRQLEEASKQPGVVARNEGDAETGARRRGAADRSDLSASVPAHAAMEPMNCTVHLARMVVTSGSARKRQR